LDAALSEAADYLAGVSQFRSSSGINDRPGLDEKAISKAVSAFRAGLSTHGLAGVQHQPAASLEKAAKALRARAASWVAARWREFFTEFESSLERVEIGHLVGDATKRRDAQLRAQKLKALRVLNPIADASQINDRLGTSQADAWWPRIRRLGQELRGALAALDAEGETMTPEVRAALERAASDGGLPLEDVTAELLAALRAAGVDDHLVVRRR
jgi:hypothetical protein